MKEKYTQNTFTEYDNFPLPVYVLNEQGNIYYVNREFMFTLGFSKKEIIGKQGSIIILPDNAQKSIEHNTHSMTKKRAYNSILILRAKNGEKKEVNYVRTQLQDEKGELKGFLCTFTEMCASLQIKKYESIHELKDTQKYLDMLGSLVVVLDRKGNIDYINNMGSKTLGYSKQECIGKNWFDIAIPLEHKKSMKKYFLEIIHNEKKVEKIFENSIQSASGKKIICTWINNCLYDNQNNISYIISSGIDITYQREAEEELQNKIAALELFQKIALQRELKMIEMKKEVNKLLESKGKPKKYRVV